MHFEFMTSADEIPEDIRGRIEDARRELDLPDVDYQATMKAKLTIARQIFERKDKSLLQVG